MSDQEKIEKLWQALIAARYEIVYWAHTGQFSKKRAKALHENMAKYDAVIEATA